MSEVQYELLPASDAPQVSVVIVTPPACVNAAVVGQGRLVAVRVEPPRELPIRTGSAVVKERAARCTFWFCLGRSPWISEVHALCGVYQRRTGNGFALVWRVAGNPYRDLLLSALGGPQRRVPELVLVVPLR